jgi:predicted permease
MSRRENDLRRELADHVDRLTADLVAQGHAPEEARRIALAEFGSVAAVADHVRDVWWTRRWREAAADIRHACRLLMRSPGFAVSSVLTLALAIGATLALLGLVDKLIFRRLPLDHASRLVQLGRTIGDRPAALSLDAVIHLRDNLTTVDGVAGHAFRRRADIPFSDMGYEVVTPEFHRLIGARAALGRTLEPEDDGKAVTVLSYACWMTKWGGARDVIGKTATIAGRPYTIVGVTARDFTGILPGVATYYTIPLTQAEARANGNFLSGVARRKAGIGLPAVRAEAESAWSRWIAAQMATSQSSLHHQRLSEQRVEVADASAGLGFLRREFSTSLYVLLAACALVLLLACVNLSNLLLSRGVARSHEFAVRLALGAPVARIVRQLLHESALLGMLGWLCAIPVSALVARAISNAIAEAAPGVRFTLQTDGRLLLLSLPLALLTTFAFGVMPAFRASRFAVKRQHGSAVSGGRLPDALIAVQVTLAVVLLATAALFVRTLHNYATAAAQLRTESVVLFTGEADPSDIRHRILDLPGVISASHVRIPPFADASWTGDPVLEGYSPKPGENISVSLNEAGPGYFAVLGTGIVRPRRHTTCCRRQPRLCSPVFRGPFRSGTVPCMGQ